MKVDVEIITFIQFILTLDQLQTAISEVLTRF